MAPAGRTPGVRAGRRARSERSAHASDAAVGGASRAGRRHEGAAAVTSVTGRRAAAGAGHLGTPRRRCGGAATALRPAPTRQTGRSESWATWARGPASSAAAAAASGRATALHVATRTARGIFCARRSPRASGRGGRRRGRRWRRRRPRRCPGRGPWRGSRRCAPLRAWRCLRAEIEPYGQRAASRRGGKGPNFELCGQLRPFSGWPKC